MDRNPISVTSEVLYAPTSSRRLTMLWRTKSILLWAKLAGALLGVASVSFPQTGARAESAVMALDFGSDANLPAAAEFDLRGRWTIVRDPTVKTGVAIQYAGASATDEQLPLAIDRD